MQFTQARHPFPAAWNETVTDGNGTHDQVEFAIFDPNEPARAAGCRRNARFAIHVPNCRRRSAKYPCRFVLVQRLDLEYLVYGDNTGTHVVEFNTSGNEIASVTDPITFSTNLPFAQLKTLVTAASGSNTTSRSAPMAPRNTSRRFMICGPRASTSTMHGLTTAQQIHRRHPVQRHLCRREQRQQHLLLRRRRHDRGPTDSFTGGMPRVAAFFGTSLFSPTRDRTIRLRLSREQRPNIATVASDGADPHIPVRWR